MTAGFGVAFDAGEEQALNSKIMGTNKKELSHSNFLNSEKIVETASYSYIHLKVVPVIRSGLHSLLYTGFSDLAVFTIQQNTYQVNLPLILR